MIERNVTIKAFDGKDIVAIHAEAGDKPSDKIVILAHGLTGHKNEYIHITATDFFTQKGYDVLRFDFYSDGDNTRKLDETTLEIQGKDLNTVIDHMRRAYDKIYVSGHSYGGATLLFAQPQATALAFWDSTFTAIPLWREEVREDAKLGHYLPWGSKKIVGKAMIDEGMALTNDVAAAKAKTITPPCVVINADSSWALEEYGGRLLIDSLTCAKEHHIVKDADHCFTNRRRMDDLLAATYNWFQKYS